MESAPHIFTLLMAQSRLGAHFHVNVFLPSHQNGLPLWGFPGSSTGKESPCNAGNPDLIPVLGRSTGEGIGCPLQYSWASLVVQLEKDPPAMSETWV